MNAHPARLVFALALLTVAGCVTVPENDAVLVDARVAVSAARSNPQVVTYAPIELDQAVMTLRDADSLAARGGSIDDVHRLALLANQRAVIAQETARTRSAEAALAAQRTAQVAQMQADLSRQQADAAQLQALNAQRQAEEAQRQAAASQLQAQSLQLSTPVVVAPPQLIDIPALPTSRGFVVTVDDGMFEPRSAQLLPSGSYTLQKVAAFLVAHPERGVAVESFSDTSDGYRDRDLSERRAAVVQSTLINLGVDSRRMVVRAYGPAYPIASNSTASGRQLNRRVEIVVSDRPGVVVPRG